MSSAVIPNNGVDLSPNESYRSRANQTVTNPIERAQLGLAPLNKSDFEQGQKVLRQSVGSAANLSQRREAIINQIAKSKSAGLSNDVAVKQATRDYNALLTSRTAKFTAQQPNLSVSEARVLAEQEILSAPNSLKNILGSAFGVAANKGKQALKTAIKTAGNTVLPFAGTIVTFLIFSKKGRLLFIGALTCICVFCFQVYQTFASEDKWNTIKESATLVECAGGTEQVKLVKCLTEQKVQEYLQTDPKPE